ncbi:MAG: hypothetical protein ACKOXB_09800 [Flavobacteriales bacterium]
MEKIKDLWLLACKSHNKKELCERKFEQLHLRYSEKHRHYHNWQHISFILKNIEELKLNQQDKDKLFITTLYHDAVYNPGDKKNEEKSAALAQKDLREIGFDNGFCAWVSQTILITQNHNSEKGDDLQKLFCDLDLQILGSTEEEYLQYTEKIRKEYAKYPDILYRPGRRKAMESLLSKEKIFQSNEFMERYEQRARTNISNELKQE